MKVIINPKGNNFIPDSIPMKLNGLILVKIETKKSIFGNTVYVCTYEEEKE